VAEECELVRAASDGLNAGACLATLAA